VEFSLQLSSLALKFGLILHEKLEVTHDSRADLFFRILFRGDLHISQVRRVRFDGVIVDTLAGFAQTYFLLRKIHEDKTHGFGKLPQPLNFRVKLLRLPRKVVGVLLDKRTSAGARETQWLDVLDCQHKRCPEKRQYKWILKHGVPFFKREGIRQAGEGASAVGFGKDGGGEIAVRQSGPRGFAKPVPRSQTARVDLAKSRKARVL
jgi:hypothetical protein